ncbi:hypothetical protein K439DRAFT_783261 [Ramaria rubella]|nr:hypothetical protein K439DRAFT_783261 [Ramaria rubella]
MEGRVPCTVCKLQSSSPNNFLLLCSCGIAYHHRCLKPSMSQPSLLTMIDAFVRGMHDKSIRAWRCAACLGYIQPKQYSLPQADVEPSMPGGSNLQPADSSTITPSHSKGKKQKQIGRHVHGWCQPISPQQGPSHTRRTHRPTAVWPPVRKKRKAAFQTQTAGSEEKGLGSMRGTNRSPRKAPPSLQPGCTNGGPILSSIITMESQVRHSCFPLYQTLISPLPLI